MVDDFFILLFTARVKVVESDACTFDGHFIHIYMIKQVHAGIVVCVVESAPEFVIHPWHLL